AVFLGFATEVDVVVKMMGLGMAVAVLLDATLVRMVLVPATMAMLGRWNWWLPRWLDRILPEIRLEVEDDDIPAPAPPRPELSPEPAAVGAAVIRTAGPAGRATTARPAGSATPP